MLRDNYPWNCLQIHCDHVARAGAPYRCSHSLYKADTLNVAKAQHQGKVVLQ